MIGLREQAPIVIINVKLIKHLEVMIYIFMIVKRGNHLPVNVGGRMWVKKNINQRNVCFISQNLHLGLQNMNTLKKQLSLVVSC